jgi:hypothetical protein
MVGAVESVLCAPGDLKDVVGTRPTQAASWSGRGKRRQSPISQTSASAVSVSMPRNARKRATVGHSSASEATWLSRSASASRRLIKPSTAASASM